MPFTYAFYLFVKELLSSNLFVVIKGFSGGIDFFNDLFFQFSYIFYCVYWTVQYITNQLCPICSETTMIDKTNQQMQLEN